MKELTIHDIETIIRRDESRVLEVKKTTGEIVAGMQSGCAFLNTEGGWLFFGIHPKTLKILGQDVADQTRQDIAKELRKFVPAIDLFAQYVDVPGRPNQKVIANALFKGGKTEGWGRGILDIFTLCKEAGLPEPEYDFVPSFVCLTIRFKNPLRPYLTGESNGALNGELTGESNEALKRLSASVQATYGIIKQNPGIQRKDIIALTKRGSSTIDRHLAVLIQKELIEHRDSKKTGGYYAK